MSKVILGFRYRGGRSVSLEPGKEPDGERKAVSGRIQGLNSVGRRSLGAKHRGDVPGGNHIGREVCRQSEMQFSHMGTNEVLRLKALEEESKELNKTLVESLLANLEPV